MIFLNESNKSNNSRHIGEITISDSLLLDWLQFEEGMILKIEHYPERQFFKLFLEHPEMPICREGDNPLPVGPSYIEEVALNIPCKIIKGEKINGH